MKLIADYSPLGDQKVGEKLTLWGIDCTLTEVGTDEAPQLAYVIDVDAKEAKELTDSKRFKKAD